MNPSDNLENLSSSDRLNITKVPEGEKMKFIYNAIEQGFSVKRVHGDDSYEFTLPVGARKSFSNETKVKRSVSTPITKKETIKKIFNTSVKNK
jgi:hypothetical protein